MTQFYQKLLARRIRPILLFAYAALPMCCLWPSTGGFLSAQTFPVEISNLPAGKSITITYKVTVNKPLEPRTTLTVSDQVSLIGQGIGTILSDDPDTPAPNDPTQTAVAGCSILRVEASAPVCGGNNRYSVDISVVQDGDPPLTGNLVIEAAGQLFITPVEPDAAPQLVIITLPANGQMVDVTAYYSDLPSCTFAAPALFRAPAGCGRISARVWEDINGDGIQNDGPNGIPNVRVILLSCAGQPLDTSLTNASGRYLFTELPPNDYKLRFDFSTAAPVFANVVATLKNATVDTLDSNINPGTKETDCFFLGAGEEIRHQDAGVYVPAQIGNLAWRDQNRNHIFDAGDLPLAGVPVKLYACSDTLGLHPLATQTTGANGMYLFTGLAPGRYKVHFGFPPTGIYERVTPNVGNDFTDSDAGPDGFTGCYTVQSRQQELSVDAGYTFCPPASSMVCRSGVNINMGESCEVEVTPDMLLTTSPPCLSTYEVRIRDSQGRNIGNTVTSAQVGQTLLATVIDKQSGASCSGNITIFDQRRPTIVCPPNTNKARYAQQVQIISSTLSQINNSANLSTFSCFQPIINPGGGNHFYEYYLFTVDREDVYTFEFSSDFGAGAALLYLGEKDNNSFLCEDLVAQSYISFTNGVFFTQLNPITRITMQLQPGQPYTLLTTSRAPGATGAFFWAAYSDGTGLINGIQPIATQAQYDLICNDLNQILNNPQSLAFTGTPEVMDNCTRPVTNITFTDQLSPGSDCTGAIITRTFTATDASGNSAQCTQVISVRKPTLADVINPPLSVFLECNDDFVLDINGNPHPMTTGYPLVKTAFGNQRLSPAYCNISATYIDRPRATGCSDTYTLLREWTILDICNIGSIVRFNQFIRVGDSTPPTITCPSTGLAGDTLTFSTTPFACSATFDVPAPGIADNCSSSTFRAEVLSDTLVPIFDNFGFVIDFEWQVFVRAMVQSTGSLRVSNIPLGNHRLRYTVTDACGNSAVIECPFKVLDRIEPTVVCKSTLAVSLGGEGLARIFPSDIDEGSRDNCGIDRIQLRRRYTRDSLTCQPLAQPYFSNWGPFIDITCCDADTIVLVEMRVVDLSGNVNECSVNVEVRDLVRPFCVAPPPVSIPCTSLPANFNPNDTTQLRQLFGTATATDNCFAVWEELAPTVSFSDCRIGTITRRFRTRDRSGNLSVNTCQQVITITKVNHYTIKFPKDADVECGVPSPDTLVVNTLGCDQLSVSVSDVQFSAIGDECYRIFRTYRVINFCEYDGSSQPIVIGRDEDCDNNPGDEDVWVLRRPNNTFIDRNNLETDNIPAAGQRGCSPNNPRGYWRTSTSLGYWQYTQVIRVFDRVAPEVIFSAPTPFCSDNDACNGVVAVPFVAAEVCNPGATTASVAVDLNNNDTIDGTLTSLGGTLAGAFPNYEIRGTFPVGKHAFAVTARDGCNNARTVRIPFEVVDCKAPAPTCRSSITVNLRPLKPPRDANGDGQEDRGSLVLRPADLLNGTATDCTGPVRYSINKMGALPNRLLDSLVLGCSDVGTTIAVEVYAWDSAANPYAVQPDGTVGGPNYSSCVVAVNVQDVEFLSCVPPNQGRVAGIIQTEDSRPVEAVEVSLGGQLEATTHTSLTGDYAFAELAERQNYTVAPHLDTHHQNGVNTVDLIIITKHILGVQPLETPYQIIAADVNNSRNVSILDLIEMRKLILGVDLQFQSNTSWRFVPSSYIFPVQTNPWFETFPEIINVRDLNGTMSTANFVAIKTGDVNNTALTAAQAMQVEPRSRATFALQVQDRDLRAGEQYTIDFYADISEVQGYQFTLHFDPQRLILLDAEYGRAKAENFGWQALEQGLLTTSWHEVRRPDPAAEQSVRLFSVVFQAQQSGRLSDWLRIGSRPTLAEAYDFQDEPRNVAIRYNTGQTQSPEFALYQNVPNPFAQTTTIGFYLPEATDARLTIYDANGRALKSIRGDYPAGAHQIIINRNELPGSGVLYYTLESEKYTATRKMIVLN
ncbi:MAG TPA: SdrD B-like domain-containing protein [Saprospiraceae bacterium]|nr:SdrD B-like domain-containing protein [Saprospiraceae bacterium]HMP23763.1 SdrD B-like domain-containing protein [Saprospiraceae bacterium]